MSIHLHQARRMAAWFLSAIALSPLPLAYCFGIEAKAPTATVEVAPVTGRVTVAGRPYGGVLLCLDAGTDHLAFGMVDHDGTFRLCNMRTNDDGAEPGRYRAHLYAPFDGREVPKKYRDPATSRIELDIAPGPNEFRIDLP